MAHDDTRTKSTTNTIQNHDTSDDGKSTVLSNAVAHL